MGCGLRIGSIVGIDVHLDWGLLIVLFLLGVSLSNALFSYWHPEWSASRVWVTASVAVGDWKWF